MKINSGFVLNRKVCKWFAPFVLLFISYAASAQTIDLAKPNKEKVFPVVQIEIDGKIIPVVKSDDTSIYYDIDNYKTEHSGKYIPVDQRINSLSYTEQYARIIVKKKKQPDTIKESDNKQE